MTSKFRTAWVLAVFAPVALGACVARPASVSGMIAQDTAGTAIPQTLEHSMTVGVVTGGEATNPLWTSEVGNEEFRAALEQSLRNFDLLAERQTGRFIVDADLIDVQQPSIGFALTVTSTVAYRVRPLNSVEPIFEETVIAPYTASATSSFLGTERLRIANEGSVRTNIEMFIDRLAARMEAVPVS